MTELPPPPADDAPPPPGAAPLEPAPEAPARRGFTVWHLLGPLLFLTALGVILACTVRAPYVMFAPGSARSTEPLITVPKDKEHQSKGDVLFTTVSVIRPTYAAAAPVPSPTTRRADWTVSPCAPWTVDAKASSTWSRT